MKQSKLLRVAQAVALTLAAALALTTLAGSIPAAAQTPQSEVNIEFREGNEVVDPVDPDNPGEPLDPDEENPGEGTGEAGPLTLNYISPISFGQQDISSVTKTYKATTQRPFVQVTDLRGTGEGWILTARAHEFMSGGVESLRGAYLTLKGGTAVSANMELPAPTPVSPVLLPTSGDYSAEIVTAEKDTGAGTWVTRWYPTTTGTEWNDNVTLTVLAGTATRAEHRAKITWTLVTNVPEDPLPED